MAAGALAGLILAGFGAGAWLRPEGAGHGTHTQLGMAPCQWAEAFDMPCATCGWTTALAHAAQGDFAASVATQPFGALATIVGAGVFWGALHVAATGSRIGRAGARLLMPGPLVAAAALLLGAWAYKWWVWTPLAGDGAAATP